MEYRYVSLPTSGRETRSDRVDEFASAELNREWVEKGWEPVAVARPVNIGQIGFLLRR